MTPKMRLSKPKLKLFYSSNAESRPHFNLYANIQVDTVSVAANLCAMFMFKFAISELQRGKVYSE